MARRTARWWIGLALVALPAASAQASTVSVEGDRLVVRAAPGEINVIDIATDGDGLLITDSAARLHVGQHCRANADRLVRCSVADVARVVVGAGDGSDSVNLSNVALPSAVFGGRGNDLLIGGSRRDDLVGGAGVDAISGGSGPDDLSGGTEDDILNGGSGDDRLDGGARHDFLDGGPGEDHIDGGAGLDRLDGGTGDDRLDGEADEDDLKGGLGDDRLLGGAGKDVLDGGLDEDRLSGDAGDDLLEGGGGDDRLEGNDGQDGFAADAGRDTIDGGVGFDKASYARRRDPVQVSLDGTPNDGASAEGDNVLPNIEQVDGGQADDVLSAPPTLPGAPAGFAPDSAVLDGGPGADILTGGDGPDRLWGGDGEDRLNGGAGADRVVGGPAIDALDGGPGDDVLLAADSGPDRLLCGADLDSFQADEIDTIEADCEGRQPIQPDQQVASSEAAGSIVLRRVQVGGTIARPPRGRAYLVVRTKAGTASGHRIRVRIWLEGRGGRRLSSVVVDVKLGVLQPIRSVRIPRGARDVRGRFIKML